MMEHAYSDTAPYKLDFVVWKKGQGTLEIIWTAEAFVQAVDEGFPEIVCILLCVAE